MSFSGSPAGAAKHLVNRGQHQHESETRHETALEELCGMEFITDITLIIDEAKYKDPRRLKRLLQSHSHEKKGSCYRVTGTYEKLEHLVDNLSPVRHYSSPATHERTSQQNEQASTLVNSVEVSAIVMAYIEQKCARELMEIGRNRFDLTVHKQRSTVQVTFRPRDSSITSVHAVFVKQRFITFYQRTASDLHVTSVSVSPHDPKDLQSKFTQLLFKPSHNKYEVTGHFVHIAQLQEFLRQNTQRSSKSHRSAKTRPVDTPSSRASRPSPTHGKDVEDESCPICMELIVPAEKETLKCKHSFCRSCLSTAFDYKPVCPTCGVLYGILTGTQPDGGTMTDTSARSSLPGYEKYGTITIHYYIPNGIQKEEHPNPGQPYEGVSRTAYLPDSPEGRRVLKLLRQAFDQRLIFTVGRSTTIGRNNMVTWNDIHHKTSTHGGPTNYGYPDPDYLSRVRDELAVKGIV